MCRSVGRHNRTSKWKGACFINFHYAQVKLFWSEIKLSTWLERNFLILFFWNCKKWEYYNDKSIAKTKFGNANQSPGCVQFAYESQYGQVQIETWFLALCIRRGTDSKRENSGISTQIGWLRQTATRYLPTKPTLVPWCFNWTFTHHRRSIEWSPRVRYLDWRDEAFVHFNWNQRKFLDSAPFISSSVHVVVIHSPVGWSN